MGQTQILMIVLAVIIVGIAVAAGINMFGKSAVTANRDAVVGDCNSIASAAMQFYKKPTEMGGGNRTFTGLTLAKLNWPASNVNGSYTLTVVDAQNITIAGTGVETGVSCSMPVNGTTGIGTPTVAP
jgi:Tfp pilus assembly protein PilE